MAGASQPALSKGTRMRRQRGKQGGKQALGEELRPTRARPPSCEAHWEDRLMRDSGARQIGKLVLVRRLLSPA
eukprot:111121-Chlamydomonas_euryale.AAC.1